MSKRANMPKCKEKETCGKAKKPEKEDRRKEKGPKLHAAW